MQHLLNDNKAMPRSEKKKQLIEFKGTTLPIVSITLHTLKPEQLGETAHMLFGDDAFFDGDAALLKPSQPLIGRPDADMGRFGCRLDRPTLATDPPHQ